MAERRAVRYCFRSFIRAEVRRRGCELATLVQDLDTVLGLFELRVAEARELNAALVELQRGLERQGAFLELLDDGFEPGDRRLEVHDGGRQYSTAQSNSPRALFTCTLAPLATAAATRM